MIKFVPLSEDEREKIEHLVDTIVQSPSAEDKLLISKILDEVIESLNEKRSIVFTME